jgi:hypothetical protein
MACFHVQVVVAVVAVVVVAAVSSLSSLAAAQPLPTRMPHQLHCKHNQH